MSFNKDNASGYTETELDELNAAWGKIYQKLLKEHDDDKYNMRLQDAIKYHQKKVLEQFDQGLRGEDRLKAAVSANFSR